MGKKETRQSVFANSEQALFSKAVKKSNWRRSHPQISLQLGSGYAYVYFEGCGLEPDHLIFAGFARSCSLIRRYLSSH
jgi:hypothetical protein